MRRKLWTGRTSDRPVNRYNVSLGPSSSLAAHILRRTLLTGSTVSKWAEDTTEEVVVGAEAQHVGRASVPFLALVRHSAVPSWTTRPITAGVLAHQSQDVEALFPQRDKTQFRSTTHA